MIDYRDSLEGIRDDQLAGFFVGWPVNPSVARFREALAGCHAFVLAYDSVEQVVAGFVTALSDGVLSSFISLLEVRPVYQGRGIGRELMRRIEEKLPGLYATDLVSDPELDSFYAGLGYTKVSGHVKRFRDRIG